MPEASGSYKRKPDRRAERKRKPGAARSGMEQELRSTLDEMRTLLENAVVGIAMTIGRKMARVNQRMVEMFGYTREEMEGLDTELIYSSGEDYDRIGRDAYPVLAQGKPYQFEMEVRRKDGSTFWCNFCGKAIDPTDRTRGEIWILQDVTVQKMAADSLRRKQEVAMQRQAVLLEMAQVHTADLDRSLQALLRRSAQTLETARCSYWTIAEDGKSMRCVLRYMRISDDFSERPLVCKAGRYPRYFRAVRELKTIAASDAQRDPRTSEFAEGHYEPSGIGSILDVPVWRQGKLVGLLCYDHVGPSRDWASEDETFALAVSDMISICLEADERRRIDEELRQSEARYRHLAENIPIGIYRNTPGPKGGFIFANPALARMFGYDSLEEFMKSSVADTYRDPEERKAFAEKLAKVGRVVGEELKLRKRDGTPIWGSVTATAVRGPSGEVEYFDGVIEDITQRKTAELELKESQQRLADIIQFLPDATMVIDEQGRITAWNRAMEAMTGVKAEDMLGKGNHEYAIPFYGERRPILIDLVLRPPQANDPRYSHFRLQGGTLLGEGEITHIGKGGLSFVGSAAALRDSSGRIVGAIETVRDVTERKRMEQALRESEQRLRGILETTTEGFCVVDNEAVLVEVNDAICGMLGLPRDQIVGRSIFELVNEENRGIFREQVERRARGERTAYEISLNRTDGSHVPCIIHATPLLDGKGEKAGAFAMVTDITERKRAEEALRRERDKAQLYLDVAGVMMLVLDSHGNVTLTNKKACQILGCPESEILGKNWFDNFLPARGREEVKATFRQLAAGDAALGEYYENPILTRSGEERVIAWHNTVLRDDAGRIVGTLSSGEDVTERKRAAEAVRASEEKFRALAENSPDAIMRFDREHRHLYVSPGVEKTSGIPAEAFIGKTHAEMGFPEGLVKVWEEAIETVFESGAPHRIEFMLPNKVWIDWILSPEFSPDGKTSQVLACSRDITERKQMEEALRAEKAFTEQALNVMLDSFYVHNRQGNFLRWNRRLNETSGYSGEEIGQMKPWDLFFEEDVPRVRAAIEEIFRTGTGRVETLLKTKDGKGVLHELAGAVMFDANGNPLLSCTARDITERKRAEDAVRESEQRIRTITDTAKDAIIMLDKRGTISFWNPAAETIFGYSAQEVMGRDLHKMLAPQRYHEAYMRGLTRFRETGQGAAIGKTLELEAIRKDGTEFPMEISLSAIRIGGEWHAVATLRDISARKRAEQEVQKAKEAAEAASEARSAFLANMSHEIRTPMNGIIGFAELALRSELDPTQRDYVTKIRTSAMSLLGIINDILDFSKIEAGKLAVEKTDFFLWDLLEDLAGLFAATAAGKDTEMILARGPEVPSALIGDPLRLRQVLVNLVSNAVKFTARGEILVSVSRLQETADTVRLRFSVKDSGIGIPPHKVRELFSPFMQADTSTTRKYGGTGLGLAISQQLVKLMGGEIHAESHVGKGSEFWFDLTFGREKGAGPSRRRPTVSIRGVKALVVDDNATSRQVLQGMLESFELQVCSVASGEEALLELRKAPAFDKPYQLVVMDYRMPGMDGLQASTHIRQDAQLSRLPIIMISAFGTDEEKRRGKALGVNAFLMKPVQQSVLFNTLMEVLGRKEGVPGEGEEPAMLTEDLVRGADLDKVRVLLVEDNEINQQVAFEILRQAGVATDIASNGEAAIEAVRRTPYDAVLMDIQMPEMDGFEATRRIRENVRFVRLPIIAMTAHAMKGDRDRCLEAGMNDYVSKPIEPRQFLSVLAKWVKPRSSADGLPKRPASEAVPSAADGEPTAPARSDEPRRAPSVAPPTPMPPGAGPKPPALGQVLAGVNVDEGVRRVGGDEPFFRSLLLTFARKHAQAGAEIRAALAKDDLPTATRLAHTLKGLAGNLAATQLAQAAQNVETALKENRPDEADQRLAALEHELQVVVQAILTSAPPAPQEPVSPAPGWPQASASAELRSLLVRLARLLLANDTEAEEAAASLAPHLTPWNLRQESQALEEQVASFDFDAAQRTLQAIAAAVAVKLEP